jgi:glutathione S-transferase
MIIYGSSLSPFVRKVLAYCAERGIPAENVVSPPGQPNPEFLEASPLGKIPAMRDGDFTLADSSAIIHYLEAKYPDGGLIPADPELRGRTIWFEEYADTVMMACGAKIFFNRFVAPKVFGRPGDELVADAAERDELPVILDYLERNAPEGEAYLVGDTLTLADLAIAGIFRNFDILGIAIDAARYPRLTAYVERILARPSFAPLTEREDALVEMIEARAVPA